MALLAHLGIERAHVAGRSMSDLQELITVQLQAIASLALICPAFLPLHALEPLQDQLLLFTGDQPFDGERTINALSHLPRCTSEIVVGYTSLLWSDIVADCTDRLETALRQFLDQQPPIPAIDQRIREQRNGEHAEIHYQIAGEGVPLLLFPLGLAPSGWEPLVEQLSQHFCVIVLGGPHLGMIPLLEARGQSLGYTRMVRNVFEELQPQPGTTILDVGCGSGVVGRWMAGYTAKQNPIVGVDINRYLLSEATAAAQRAQLGDLLHYQEGNAEALPFPDNHFDVTFSTTVMEEVDADKMLAELIRVTKPSGRVGVIVRATDMDRTINIPLRQDLRDLYEVAIFRDEGTACMSASLYRRFHASALTNVQGWPHLATFTDSTGAVARFLLNGILMNLDDVDRMAWQHAVAQAAADGTFFMTWPHHCAVGMKV